ncbi:unnamed protein product [Ectocarpus sp. CCAP 1310/34]|nr:unnamed protein product [Ectocarpus sp. CCAP 1310/34]
MKASAATSIPTYLKKKLVVPTPLAYRNLPLKAFEWLGYWYQGVGGDRERARGCFLRSVKLDPALPGAGEALASLYLHTGQETLAVALFRQCAAVSVACHWAWAGLGRTKILEGKLAEAASHIQQAIRGCPTSWSYWSDLGWCYHAEGKQAAALKAYTRAEDLLADQQDPPSSVEAAARVRVRTQVGTIQRQIGQVDEAVSSFNDALALDPESILALEGSGEAYLAQAHARTSEGLYTAAAKALRNGRDATKRFLDLAKATTGNARSGEGAGAAPSGGRSAAAATALSMECAWKLLGDLQTYAHKLPPMCFENEGSRERRGGSAEGGSVLVLGTSRAAVEQAALAKEGARNRLDFVAQGADAYRNLVQLLEAREKDQADGDVDGQSGETSATAGQGALVPTKAAAYYDLGLNYLLRGRLICSDAGEGSGLIAQELYEGLPEVAELTRSAEEAFRRSVEADPAYSEAWNGLGATMSQKPLVQQHCWVRSVQLEHNPSAWANLGMLYVRWGMDIQAIYTAYESFGGLQAVTDHPTMWVGLGLLKEKEACQPGVAATKRRRLLSQASDAYYSSLETGQHVDGLLGLGTTAGQTHSQDDALVALQQHLDLNPTSAQAWNYLGAASELAGRGTQAVAAYRRALGLLEEQRERFKATVGAEGGEVWEGAVALTKGNVGRALVLVGAAEEAVACLGEAELAQADNALQLGRAHALLGNWDTALAALEEEVAVGDAMQDERWIANIAWEVMELVFATSFGRNIIYQLVDRVGAHQHVQISHPTPVTARPFALVGAVLTTLSFILRGILESPLGVDGLISGAAVRYLRGDTSGAAAAAGTLMAQRPGDRRVLHTVVSLAALVGDSGLVQQASRAMQAREALGVRVRTLPKRATSSDHGGSFARQHAAEEDLWAIHLAMRATGFPDSESRRALLKAVHLSPSSITSWARLGAATADSAAATDGRGRVSAKVGEACLSAAEKLAMFELLGVARDAGSGGGGNNGEELAAKDLGTALSGIAKTVLCSGRCSGGGGKGKAGNRSRAVRATSRAVHLYPGEPSSWRYLARAMVGEALSWVYKSPGTRDVMLRDAHSLFRGIPKPKSDSGPTRGDGSQDSLLRAEADYLQLLLGQKKTHDGSSTGKTKSFPAALMAARLAAHGGVDGHGGHEDAIKRYKLALREEPRALVGWRELAVCYQLSNQHNAATAALECGAQAAGPAGSGDCASSGKRRSVSATAAPLYLQLAAGTLMMSPGEEDAGLAAVGDAFRLGKGGAVGHVLRGLLYSGLGKDSLAAGSFSKAREAGLDPAVAALADKVSVPRAGQGGTQKDAVV